MCPLTVSTIVSTNIPNPLTRPSFGRVARVSRLRDPGNRPFYVVPTQISKSARSGAPADLRRRGPQPREAILQQQLQNVQRIALVGLLLAHVAGPDLRRIPDPDFMAQLLQQVHEPLTIAAGLQSNPRRRRQLPVELLGCAVAVAQLVLVHFSGFVVENRHLLPTRMEITPYNQHRRLLPSPASFSSSTTKERLHRIEREPSLLSNHGRPRSDRDLE